MPDLQFLNEVEDVGMKQLVLFYELCKLGVVKFDLGNEAHVKLLTKYIDSVADSSKTIDMTQIDEKNRYQLHYLIAIQLLKNVVPKEN